MNNRVTIYYEEEEKNQAYADMCMFMAALLKQDLLEVSYGPSAVDPETSDFSFHTTDEQHKKLKDLFMSGDQDLFPD